jgi:hypothetical protein
MKQYKLPLTVNKGRRKRATPKTKGQVIQLFFCTAIPRHRIYGAISFRI